MPTSKSQIPSEIFEDDAALAKKIRESKGTSSVVKTTLRTDERVIARVTDGIYRQPASALRELISNAYDADATRVVVKTDAPRFQRITVEDNGLGMTPEALANLLHHIGGSAKRIARGTDLGITNPENPTLSPGGRRLIGKIGIGLFSVSQLTHAFQIITKVRGDSFRTVATVVLRQYSEDNGGTSTKDSVQFESGKVNIWRERAADKESQGTSIVLTNLRPQARDTLRSREIWSAVELVEAGGTDDERPTIQPPIFHVGRVDSTGNLIRRHDGKLNAVPWSSSDDPDQAFAKIVNAVWEEVNGTDPNPQLDRIFDYYLRMVWQLALAVPLPYVEVHPFDMEVREFDHVFRLSNQPKGGAEEVTAAKRSSLREAMGLVTPAKPAGGFEVLFDNLRLSRPLRFRNLPETAHALKQPLMFVGQCREEFKGTPKEFSGGPLSFEAYLLWTPKVAPTEHQGALVRIHGASGTLFDSTFMRYQVAEQTRLRQITCEIFVREGLDAALNIDRESFNNAHPHSVFITKWLHNALRQLATAQKRLAAEARRTTREEEHEQALTEIQKVALRAWRRESDDSSAKPPRVEFSAEGKREGAKGPAHVYKREEVLRPSDAGGRAGSRSHVPDPVHEERLRAVVQVLAAFGLLDRLSPRRQEALLQAIYEILVAGGR